MEDSTTQDKKLTVVGIGRSGIKILNQLIKKPEAAWMNFVAVDTDKESLENAKVKTRIAAGFEWTNGLGCGGNVTKGERTLSLVRNKLNEALSDATLLVVVGGLGGGTATGGSTILASIAKTNKIPSIFITTLPFSFEGHSKRRVADDGIKELLPAIDILVCLPNDLLFSSLRADTPVDQAFEKADIEVASAVVGISEVLRCGNLIPADLGDFRAILHKKKSTCSIGIGRADSSDGPHRCHIALERMLKSALLGSTKQLSSADVVFLTLAGDEKLSIGEVKKALESVEKILSPNSKLIVGANTDSAYQNSVQLTIVTIHYDNSETIAKEKEATTIIKNITQHQRANSGTKRQEPTEAIQGLLPLQEITRGIFTPFSTTEYQGEDLDIPTFQRQNIIIDKGETK